MNASTVKNDSIEWSRSILPNTNSTKTHHPKAAVHKYKVGRVSGQTGLAKEIDLFRVRWTIGDVKATGHMFPTSLGLGGYKTDMVCDHL